MKKWAIIGFIAVIVVGSAVILSLIMQANKTADKAATTDTIEKEKFSNACQVATKDAASTAFGVTFTEGKQDGGGITSSNSAINTCRYNEVTDDTPTGLMKAMNLTIDVNTYPTTNGAKSALDATKKTEKIDDKIVQFIATRIEGIDHEKTRAAITTLAKKALN